MDTTHIYAISGLSLDAIYKRYTWKQWDIHALSVGGLNKGKICLHLGKIAYNATPVFRQDSIKNQGKLQNGLAIKLQHL